MHVQNLSELELFLMMMMYCNVTYTIWYYFRPVIDQGFTFLGMQYTSASFASALMNAVPSVTFVLAVIFR